MKILLLKTWTTNVGNGFIDKGARATIERAFPNAEIIEASGYPNYVRDEKLGGMFRGAGSVFGSLGESLEQRNRERNEKTFENFINIGEFVDPDLAVFPGCILYEYALRKYQSTLMTLAEDDVPILFLGVGGVDYDSKTRTYVRSILDDLTTTGLITRDERAYDTYADQFEFARKGIDCGFFINDWHLPSDSDRDFVLATFDKQREPSIETNQQIVRPTHVPFNDTSSFVGLMKNIIPQLNHRGPEDLFEAENSFLSDCLEDYLFLYANADETHSDRIHACVPALAYGNSAKFYYQTPRAGLFDQVLEVNISDRLVSVNVDHLEERKSTQVEQVKKAVEYSNA